MINKLEISNVGRFKSSKTDGDKQYFKKSTFIYEEGKGVRSY